MDNNQSIYDRLGVKKIINAAGTYTVIGGSKMSPKTLKDMADAALCHVEIRELQAKVHKKLAEITNNEAAYICNGAASGLYLSTASCVVRKVGKGVRHLKKEDIMSKEVLTFAAHRNPYDWAIRQLGVKVVQLGYPNMILPLTEEDLINGISDNTVAIYFVAGDTDAWLSEGAMELEKVIEVAKRFDIPVIVDAAAQVPPVENLWKFTQKGADIVLFSGGKDLRGPQSSGLIVGKKEMLDIITETGFPNYGLGRMLKVGREEIVGLFSAVEQYIEMNHYDRRELCEEIIKKLINELEGSKLFSAIRTYPNEAGQPIARAFVNIEDNERISPDKLKELLMEGEYGIYANTEDENGVYINPMTLHDGEIDIIIQRFKDIESSFN